MPYESSIRDQLAKKLQLIEGGLTCDGIEFRLDSIDGRFCFVDILARDRNGHIVVIEAKVNDGAAREALHELNKYCPLVAAQLGVDESRVRAIVASTEWRELHNAFHQFAKDFSFSLKGIRLILDENGTLIDATEVVPVKPTRSPDLNPNHWIYQFDSQAARDVSVKLMLRSLEKSQIEAAFLVCLDFAETSDIPPDPFGLYFAPYLLPEPMNEAEESARSAKLSEDVAACPDAFATSYDELVVSDVLKAIRDRATSIGHSNRVAFSKLLCSWKAVELHRHGKRANVRSVVDVEQAIEIITGVGIRNTGNRLGLKRNTSPRSADWQKVMTEVKKFVRDNLCWREELPNCLTKIASAVPDSDVSIEIHMVDNLLFAMIQEGLQRIAGAMPYFTINAKDSNEQWSVIGGTIWDGGTWPKSVSEFLKEFEALHPESRFSFGRDFRQFHDTVLQLHGLYPFILETTERKGELIHTRFHTDTQLPFEVERTQVANAIKHNWLNDHIEYLKGLHSMILYG